jgi:hypothetical protein
MPGLPNCRCAPTHSFPSKILAVRLGPIGHISFLKLIARRQRRRASRIRYMPTGIIWSKASTQKSLESRISERSRLLSRVLGQRIFAGSPRLCFPNARRSTFYSRRSKTFRCKIRHPCWTVFTFRHETLTHHIRSFRRRVRSQRFLDTLQQRLGFLVPTLSGEIHRAGEGINDKGSQIRDDDVYQSVWF